jgi:hypothetical protein
MTVFEIPTEGPVAVTYATSNAKDLDLGSFSKMFKYMTSENLHPPFFAYGKAYYDDRYVTENIYVVTPLMVFCTQKRLPFLWNPRMKWDRFKERMRQEEDIYKKDWPKVSHVWRFTQSLWDDDRLPFNWRIVYAKTDGDSKWEGEIDRPLGYIRMDGEIMWFADASELCRSLI